MADPTKKRATVENLAALVENMVGEIIDGELFLPSDPVVGDPVAGPSITGRKSIWEGMPRPRPCGMEERKADHSTRRASLRRDARLGL